MITLDESTVDLAHEALIHAWPRLEGWLTDDRAGLRVHRQLTEAAHTWQSFDRDDGVLYRGVRLALAREWQADRHPRLTSVEQAFLHTSVRRAEAEQTAAARRAQLMRYLVAGLAALLVVAAGLGVVAWQQRGDAVAMHRVVPCPWVYADLPTALRGLLSTGPASRAIDYSGWVQVADTVSESISPCRRDDGSYLLDNSCYYLVAPVGRSTPDR